MKKIISYNLTDKQTAPADKTFIFEKKITKMQIIITSGFVATNNY